MSSNPAAFAHMNEFGAWGSTIVLTCVIAIIVTLLVLWFYSMPDPVWVCPHCHKRIKDLEEARGK